MRAWQPELHPETRQANPVNETLVVNEECALTPSSDDRFAAKEHSTRSPADKQDARSVARGGVTRR
jgi:hypothetical protein